FTLHLFSFFSLLRPPPVSTLFPYTTLFRSIVPFAQFSAELQQPRQSVWTFETRPAFSPQICRFSFQVFSRETLAAYLRGEGRARDRKSTRLNSSHLGISYAVFCLKKKKNTS